PNAANAAQPPNRAAANAAPGTPGTPATPDTGETPPAPPPATPLSTDSHKTTNYDIDHTVQYLEHPAWTLRGINIAVLVNNPSGSPIPAARIQSINTLVASAIGVGQNPHVTVVDLPFDVAAEGPEGAAPWWDKPALRAVRDNSVLALAGLLVLFGGVFPMLRRMETMQMALATVRPRLGIAAANLNVATGVAALRTTAPANVMRRMTPAAAGEPEEFHIDPETVRALVVNDPARTAQVIKGWIADGRSGANEGG
ncbi:MAG TPA: flagellar M-ring protein FliF C-terminal domain-containing protein, partial [Stellaceae bacterium]|nr:flagellar M-ring protein FliF C-terminal domain-containing protein [Stellaceae bacterium]